jgi:hypothetical protein
MFGFFSKKADTPSESSMVYDQAVIIEIGFAGLDDFGTSQQQQSVRTLEKELEAALSPPAGLDGDEFGEGTAVIYLYGTSADIIFETAEPILKKSPFQHMTITMLYGPADDPKTEEKKFSM